MNLLRRANIILAILIALAILSTGAFADWIKLDPPPDADKEYGSNDATCWLATAANMLAGAGYGYSSPDTSSVQARADHIYEQLKDHFDVYT